MKTVLIALIAFLAFTTAVSAQVTEKSSKKESHKMMYSCPMHPHEMSMKEGVCLKCGMEMMKYKGATYSCPMHPHEMSMKEGKCPKCGMDMVKAKKPKYVSKMKAGSKSTESKYVCKMDGTAAHMAGKCPKCGMDMTKMDDDNDEEHHKH